MKRNLLLFIIILIWANITIPSAYACGGGDDLPPTLDQMIERDILVRGVVVENNAGNSIIRVQRYLIGNGSQYLLVVRQSPSLYIRKVERNYDYGCDTAESAIAGEGALAYFSLDYQSDGTYTIGFRSNLHRIPIIDYPDRQVVEYHTYNGDITDEANLSYDNFERFEATQQEFEVLVAELSGQQPHPPGSYVYPRFRPLYITTQSGQHYMMPVDSHNLRPVENLPQTCADSCVLESPDGSHYIHRVPVEEDTYALWYTGEFDVEDWYAGLQFDNLRYTPIRFTAQEMLFSPDSNFLLGWYEDELTIYGINMWDNYGYYARLPTISPIWYTQLATDNNHSASDFSLKAVWSGNSNAIVYLDATGLNWMDLTTMVQPRLLVEMDAIDINNLTVLELSTTGRYLRYGSAQEWILVDVFSGLEYDDAIVSPDETRFAQIAPEVEMKSVLDNPLPETEPYCMEYADDNTCVRYATPSMDACNVPLALCVNDVALPAGFELQRVLWTSNNSLIMFTCETDNPASCYFYERNLDENDNRFSENLTGYQTNAYDYDTVFANIAWAGNDYQIRFGTSRSDDPIDFSAVLDSPIISIEWGEALWYQAP